MEQQYKVDESYEGEDARELTVEVADDFKLSENESTGYDLGPIYAQDPRIGHEYGQALPDQSWGGNFTQGPGSSIYKKWFCYGPYVTVPAGRWWLGWSITVFFNPGVTDKENRSPLIVGDVVCNSGNTKLADWGCTVADICRISTEPFPTKITWGWGRELTFAQATEKVEVRVKPALWLPAPNPAGQVRFNFFFGQKR